ncbi:MAG: TlpA family protein disulfide reductase [Candidatus Marinimicrobia bacterium]|jgi:peroxiredoxin|nr:TlpA family protein disulfide reductase [Candidatus Neomarinimicrobiota bacterium]
MKNILSLILVSSFIFVSCDNGTAQQKTTDSKTKSTASSQKSNEGKKQGGINAPDFTLADLNGNWVSLSDLKGKVVLLNFWGTWCGPCRREIPDFVNLSKKYKKDGLEIVGITLTSGSAEKIQEFSDKWNINYTLLTDIEGNETQVVTWNYGKATGQPINGIPTTFIIDRDGVIRERYVGPRSEEIFYKDLKPYL